MSQALRKLTGAVSKSNTCLIFINQLREKIGVMFGNPETTTGGRALKFYSSVRVDIRRIASIKDGDSGRRRSHTRQDRQEQAGAAVPRGRVRHHVRRGHLAEGDLLDLAVDKRIVEKSGAWFAYGGERLGQGRENAKQFLKDNPDIFKAIEERVRRELGLSAGARNRNAVGCGRDPRLSGGQGVLSSAGWAEPLGQIRLLSCAEVAQLVEHVTENHGVDSSILSLATTNKLSNHSDLEHKYQGECCGV